MCALTVGPLILFYSGGTRVHAALAKVKAISPSNHNGIGGDHADDCGGRISTLRDAFTLNASEDRKYWRAQRTNERAPPPASHAEALIDKQATNVLYYNTPICGSISNSLRRARAPKSVFSC